MGTEGIFIQFWATDVEEHTSFIIYGFLHGPELHLHLDLHFVDEDFKFKES
jgi:hypothetical protein